MKYTPTYAEALAIQRLVAKDAKAEKMPAKDRSALARAFIELETLKLRLRMKPAPKPVDVSEQQPKRKSAGAAKLIG